MVASVVIWALGYYPNHDAYQDVAEQQENSYIGRIGKAVEPVIEPLGFDWKLGIGILSGVGAKELVVSTLGVLYADDAEADGRKLGRTYSDYAVGSLWLYGVCVDIFSMYCYVGGH